MQLHTQAHIDLMEMFERIYWWVRFDKEPKDLWAKGHIYQNGETNELFIAFRHGAAYGKAVTQREICA